MNTYDPYLISRLMARYNRVTVPARNTSITTYALYGGIVLALVAGSVLIIKALKKRGA